MQFCDYIPNLVSNSIAEFLMDGDEVILDKLKEEDFSTKGLIEDIVEHLKRKFELAADADNMLNSDEMRNYTDPTCGIIVKTIQYLRNLSSNIDVRDYLLENVADEEVEELVDLLLPRLDLNETLDDVPLRWDSIEDETLRSHLEEIQDEGIEVTTLKDGQTVLKSREELFEEIRSYFDALDEAEMSTYEPIFKEISDPDFITLAFVQSVGLNEWYNNKREVEQIGDLLEVDHDQPLHKFFRTSLAALRLFEARARADLFNACYFNVVGKLARIVTKDSHLNENIAQLKQRCYATLRSFIDLKMKRNIDTRIVTPRLFFNNTCNTRGLNELLRIAKEYFDNLDNDTLFYMYNNINKNVYLDGTLLASSDIISAYEAFIMLHEDIFDGLVASFNKNISIVNTRGVMKHPNWTSGQEQRPKYSFGQKSNYYKNWSAEDLDSTELMGNVASMIIEQIPIYSYKEGHLPIRGDYMTKKRFFNVMNYLKSPEFFNKCLDLELKRLLILSHKNPIEAWPKIFLRILDKKVLRLIEGLLNDKKTIWKDEALNIIYSFYDFVCNPDNEVSIYTASRIHMSASKVISGYSLFEAIIGAIYRTNEGKYISYLYSLDDRFFSSIEISKRSADATEIQILNQFDIANSELNILERRGIVSKYSSILDKAIVLSTIPFAGKDIKVRSGSERSSLEILVDGKSKRAQSFIPNNFYNFRRKMASKDYNSMSESDLIFERLLEYIEDSTGINIREERWLDILLEYFNNNGLLDDLLTAANNAARNNIAYIRFEKDKEDGTLPEGIDDITAYVTKIPELAYYYGSSVGATTGAIDLTTMKLSVLDRSTLLTMRSNLAKAMSIISGEIFDTTIKNNEGNSVAVNKMGSLSTNMAFLIQERIINNPTSGLHNNLFATNLDNYEGSSAKTLLTVSPTLKKTVADFSESEHIYSAIMYDFFGSLSKGLSKTNTWYDTSLVKDKATFTQRISGRPRSTVQFQPTTYADKTSIIEFKYKDGFWIPFKDGGGMMIHLGFSSMEELKTGIKKTVGEQYKTIYSKVISDYRYALTDEYLNELRLFYLEAKKPKNVREVLKKLDTYSKSSNRQSYLTDKEIQILMSLVPVETITVEGKTLRGYKELAYVKIRDLESLYLYSENIDGIDYIKKIKAQGEDLSKLLHHFRFILTKEELIKSMDYIKSENLTQEELSVLDYILDSINNPKIKNPLGTMTDEEVLTLISMLASERYEEITSLHNHCNAILDLHINPKNKFIELNKLLDYYATQLYDNDAVFEQRMQIEQFKYLLNLIKYNINFDKTKDIRLALKVIGINNGEDSYSEFTKNWIDSATGRMILAKTEDGTPINFSNINQLISRDGTDIDSMLPDQKIILNPLLERYFYADFLLSENLRLAMTGASFVHKNTAKLDSKSILAYAIYELASREGAQYKRQVIVPATLQYYLQGSITGMPLQMNTMYVSDEEARMWNIKGEKAKEDAHDGSGFSHPLTVILSNWGLGDCSVGEDQKNIGHVLTDYSTAILKKYASFCATNDRMRSSRWSPNSLWALVYNMSTAISFRNIREFIDNGFSLNRTLLGKLVKLKDFTVNNKDLMFERGGKYYKILELDDHLVEVNLDEFTGDINSLIKKGDKYYKLIPFEFVRKILEIKLNDLGEVVEVGSAFSELLVIDNIWNLMEALGGTSSVDIVNGKFKYGAMNLVVTANYVNNIGRYTGERDAYGNPTEFMTQDNTLLPLKGSFIHDMVNNSGTKSSVNFLNSKQCWVPKSRVYFTSADTYGIGPQMDADHEVVGGDHLSTITEPSLIVAAVEANGLTHEISREVYKDLGKVALAAIAKVDKVTKAYIESGYNTELKSQLYQTLGEMIIKSVLKDEKEFGLAASVLRKVLEIFHKKGNHKDDQFLIPFSSPSLFGKTLAEFTSTLNKKAIKRKFSGEGAVMAPAYNIMTYVLLGNGEKLLYSDVYRRAVAKYGDLDTTPLVFDPNNEEESQAFNASDYTDLPLCVEHYLLDLQDEALLPENMQELSEALPEDKIIVEYFDGTRKFVDLSDYDVYILLKSEEVANIKGFYRAIFTDPTNSGGKALVINTNLKPLIISWKCDGKTFNLYDVPLIREAIKERRLSERSAEDYNKLQNQEKKLGRLLTRLNTIIKVTSDPLVLLLSTEEYNKVKADLDKVLKLLAKVGAHILTKLRDIELLEQITRVLDSISNGEMPILHKKGHREINKHGFNYVKIDSGTLKSDPAEMLMSPIYADALGIDINTTLSDIKDAGYFRDRIKCVPNNDVYDFAFLTASGDHMYISTTVKEGMTKNTYLTNNLNRLDNFIIEDGKYYRIDSNGDIMYQVGTVVTDEATGKAKINWTVGIYTDKDNNEILVIKDPKIIASLYSKRLHFGVLLNLKTEVTDVIKKTFDNLSRKLPELVKEIRDDNYRNISKTSTLWVLKYRDQLASKRFTSFRKSLEYTVGRIPALSLQSFMKMKCIGFLETNKNVVHVSHYLTWLLGSDYDIDKAYLMGYDFDKNGLFTAWSPFFDYSSEQSLDKSLLLPTPNSKTYSYSEDSGVDISEFVSKYYLAKYLTLDEKILLLNLVDEYSTVTWGKYFNLKAGEEVLDLINQHNLYFENNPGAMVGGFKNSVASKVLRVVSDVRNALLSYSPISMGPTRTAADNSKAGEAVKTMTAFDPLTKFIMTVQNMAGKKVIGITATGEKIFFALSYYYNEMVYKNNTEWMKNAYFLKVLYKMKLINPYSDETVLKESIKSIIANVNFMQNPEFAEIWKNTLLLGLNALYNVKPGESSEEVLQLLAESIKELLNFSEDLALVISALLSAATDNAKELILDKINAGPDLAGLYLHMIIMGMDFQDIASLMTSDTMYAIKTLCQINYFDSTTLVPKNVVKEAIRKAKHGPNPLVYFQGYIALEELFNTLKEYLKAKYKKEEEGLQGKELLEAQVKHLKIIDSISSQSTYLEVLDKIFKEYALSLEEGNEDFKVRDSLGNILSPISYVTHGASTKEIRNFNKFLEDYQKYAYIASIIDYEVLNKIENIRKEADITTTLGLAILSANLGFATDLPGKLRKILQLENIVYSAEEPYLKLISRGIEDDNLIKKFAKDVNTRNVLISVEEAEKAYRDAFSMNIPGNFSIEKFLNDSEYQEVALRYYNCIRLSYNLLDIMIKLPHYNAMYQVFNDINTADNNFVRKFKFIRSITKRLSDLGLHYNIYTEDELKCLENAVNQNMICEWLKELKIQFVINEGTEYFDKNGHRLPVEKSYTIDLSTDEGRATYKLFFELVFIKNLLKGIITSGGTDIDTSKRGIINNLRLIRDMVKEHLKNSREGIIIPYLKMPLNLLKTSNIHERNILEEYCKDLSRLASFKFLGYSILDMIFLYNLIVNHDRFGRDRITSLFGGALKLDTSLAFAFYKFLGKLDYNTSDSDVQDGSLQMNNEDALIAMALVYGPELIDFQKEKYVIQRNGRGRRNSLLIRVNTSSSLMDPELLALIDEANLMLLEENNELGITSSVVKPKLYTSFRLWEVKTDDYFKYFTLRNMQASNDIDRMFIDSDLLNFDTKGLSDPEKAINEKVIAIADKIESMMLRNSFIGLLNC